MEIAMTTEEIQKETNAEKLQKRLAEADVRKKERRLLWRKIFRLEAEKKAANG
jgi:hypothetical protein